MAYSILNKAFHFSKINDITKQVKITSAMALKKKYPGKIFVEAQGEK